MINLVVGGQFGGEGKGKIASLLAYLHEYHFVCRCGGVNSSHTVVFGGKEFRLRMMPASAVIDKRPMVIFGAGTLIHLPTLFSEIEMTGYGLEKIVIDPQAGIVSQDCVEAQRADRRYDKIGSTLTGTGFAASRRALRELELARDVPELQNFLGDVPRILYEAARERKRILIEGHQGAGLSNYHGDYPYTSSRDCTAAECLSELGLGTSWKHDIFLTIKVFPTRNHEGALFGEMDASDADALGIREFGGGSWGISDRRRRVGVLDFDQLRSAVMLNTPRYLAVTGLDLWDKATHKRALSREAKELIRRIEEQTGVAVKLVSTGRETEDYVVLKPGNSSDISLTQ